MGSIRIDNDNRFGYLDYDKDEGTVWVFEGPRRQPTAVYKIPLIGLTAEQAEDVHQVIDCIIWVARDAIDSNQLAGAIAPFKVNLNE